MEDAILIGQQKIRELVGAIDRKDLVFLPGNKNLVFGCAVGVGIID